MLSHEFSHVPSLPHHTHVIERAKRAKATLGGAEASEASQVGEASEASEPTCNMYATLTPITEFPVLIVYTQVTRKIVYAIN